MQVCKELVEPTENMENLLARTTSENIEQEIQNALKLSATHFAPLERFYNELEAMYKYHIGKKPEVDVK